VDFSHCSFGNNGYSGLVAEGTMNLISGNLFYRNGETADDDGAPAIDRSQLSVTGRKVKVQNNQFDAGQAGDPIDPDTLCLFIRGGESNKNTAINVGNNTFVDEAEQMVQLVNSGGPMNAVRIHHNEFVSGDSSNADNSQTLLRLVRRSGSGESLNDVRFVDNSVSGTFTDDLFTLGDQAEGIGEIVVERNSGIDNATDVRKLQSRETGATYNHDGSGDRVAGPATYTDSGFVYHNGVTESANTDQPEGNYPPGQTVFFTDTGDGSASGAYVVDDTGSPQGPI
jgi:hypothetical protein